MDQSEQHAGRQDEPPAHRRRGWIASGALVGTGLLAGAILAGTLSANAAGGGGGGSVLAAPAAATSTETPSADPDSDLPGHGWRDWWHGDDAQVPGDAAAKVEDAVLAQYPDATIWWIRSDPDGGYDAYLDTADGKDLAVHLDDAFAVTGTDDLPDADDHDGDGHGWAGHGWIGHGWDGACADDSGASVPDDAAAKVEDAVLAQYPDATIWWIRSDPDGGYDAYLDTADGKDLAVHLDDAFAVTGTDDLPDADDGWHHGGNAVPDETAAQVEDAVLASYPGATVPWTWADTEDGGYSALVLTAEDDGVVVHLDDSFAITETENVPGC
ncbi:hypothetical protein [Modestobacter altitudinis]|uniref:hypothetical protein n=1 Tax=Modestobacter altitudinis TaxID=2213158 RepID=UPI00110CACA9|nr:hypothetical protein [Modestobacter altitudinis]